MYWEIERSFVQFDEFDGYEKTAKTFKEILCTYEIKSPDSFYNAILYGSIFELSKKIFW